MNFRRVCFALSFVTLGLVGSAVGGCTVSTNTDPSPNPTPVNEDAGPGADANADAATAVSLSFKPSNINEALKQIDASQLGDFVVSSADCTIDTESKLVGCDDMSKLAYVVVDQPGSGKIGMYVAKSIRIEPNGGLVARGTYALALVALDSIDIQGYVDVGARTSYDTAGGFVHATTDNTKGGGPGGGGAGSSTNGAAGGSFCGIGGKGVAATAGGTAAEGGAAYGTLELIPLLGGSAGGNGTLPDSGSGGGAVQLVAGKTFSLGLGGWINAGGGGGAFQGGATGQMGSGGGSGGAILIESPAVTLTGTLAANGGAGGAKEYGADGKSDGAQAPGNTTLGGSMSGAGSAAETINGGDSTVVADDNVPGGGGGAGRIRINSESGNSALSAKVLAPSANTPCTTEGTLTK